MLQKGRRIKYSSSIVSFDDELLDNFFAAYKNRGNGHKGDLFLALKELVFNDESVSSAEDIQTTLINLGRLETMLQELLDSEQDAFARVIISATLKALVEYRESLRGDN